VQPPTSLNIRAKNLAIQAANAALRARICFESGFIKEGLKFMDETLAYSQQCKIIAAEILRNKY